MTVKTGHIDPFWDDGFKQLTYIKKKGFNDEEIKAWEDMGYHENNLKSFTGKLYDNSNPMPHWVNVFDNMFGLYNQSYTFYVMETLEIMPVHRDHFRTYCNINNVTTEQVHRVLIMLENWKPGHYLEIDGIAYVNWRAGDWFMWRGTTPHAAANIGVDPRYTLQITGLSTSNNRIDKLFTVNIPDIEHNPYVDDLFFNKVFLPYAVPKEDFSRKAMWYTHNQYIKELDNINHTTKFSDQVHIHLFEPLCSYLNSKTTDCLRYIYYSEFPHDFDPMDMRSLELDSIYNYAQRNDLKVKVYTGDYNVEKYYPYYSDRIELVCNDLFLRGCVLMENLEEEPNLNFNKKFISLNWRFAKHRQMIATYLANEDGYLSWYYSYDFEKLNKHQSHEYIDLNRIQQTNERVYNRLKQNCDLILANSPFVLDIDTSNNTAIEEIIELYPPVDGYHAGYSPVVANKDASSLQPYYRDAFMDIVTETRYAQPTANISEKILQAIQYKKPFVLVGAPHTLEYLKSFGFKTFSDFWDESYDNEENHETRLLKIFDVIDYILSKDIEELRELYKQMLPILTHNFEIYKNFKRNLK